MDQKISTICRDCLLAVWGPNGVQVDCELHRLEKFKERGVNVELVEDKYFKIHDRVCTTCVKTTSTEMSVEEVKEKVMEMIKLNMAMLCVVQPNSTLDLVKKTVESFINQTPKPSSIFILLPEEAQRREVYVDIMRKLNPPIKWTVMKPADECMGLSELIDEAVLSATGKFYTICSSGYEYPANWMKNVNNAINTELKTFLCVLPDKDGNAPIVLCNVHTEFGGNLEESIIEKIKNVATEEDKLSLILTYDELIGDSPGGDPTKTG